MFLRGLPSGGGGSGGSSFTNPYPLSTTQEFLLTNAVTDAVTDVLKLTHVTSGTATSGIGVGISYCAENAAGTTVEIASVDAYLNDVTNASSGPLS